MQNVQELQDKIFFESMTILETLSKISTKDELLSRQDLFSEVADRISFLRILEKNKESLTPESASEFADSQSLSLDSSRDLMNSETLADEVLNEEEGIEEFIFTNEINEIEDEPQFSDIFADSPVLDPIESEELKDIIADVQQEAAYEDRIAEKERKFHELEESRRKIVEFDKKETEAPSEEPQVSDTSAQNQSEKKFKLAHIKGLKAVQNFFDADPLEKLQDEQSQNVDKSSAGSILKTNIPTDFMEAEKKRPGFRLDLNDKVAFTKILFNNDEQELTQTIDKLNSYDNLEDAKAFLSEIYYHKDWQKSDEYAQRLWSLVENKFL